MGPEAGATILFLEGGSFTVGRRDVAGRAATIARVSQGDANTCTRLFASRQKIQAMAPAERAKTREGIFWERIGNLSGYDAARQIWESPHMRAANLSACHFAGAPGSDPGTGNQALSTMNHLYRRPIPN